MLDEISRVLEMLSAANAVPQKSNRREKTMTKQAHSTLARAAKGPMAPPPDLNGDLKKVADAVAAWHEVAATTHWQFGDHSRIDGIDFYVGSDELGHLHLDGSIHLATTPELQSELVAGGLGSPFVYARGWTQASVARLGVEGAVALFRRNYDRLRPARRARGDDLHC